MELGHHETQGPGPRDLVPALRDPRHLLKKGHSLGDLAHRDRQAKEFIEHAFTANDGTANDGTARAVHADRGTSMTSNTVAGLYAKA